MKLKKSKPQNHHLELSVLWSFEAVFMKTNFQSCNCMHCYALILESLWLLHSLACVLVWKQNFNLGYPDFLGTVVLKQTNDTSGEMELEGGVGICQMYTRVLECCYDGSGQFQFLAQPLGYVRHWVPLFFCLLVWHFSF